MSTALRAIVLLGSIASLARAQPIDYEPPLPFAFVDRPLTLTKGTISPTSDLRVLRDSDPFSPSPADYYLSFYTGIAGGVTDNVTLSATVVPLQLYPRAGYTNAQIAVSTRTVHAGFFELGPSISADLPGRIPGDHSYQVALAGAMRFHLGHWARIDTGLGFAFTALNFVTDCNSYCGPRYPITTFSVGDAPLPGIGITLGVPLAIAIQPARWLFFQVSSGISVEPQSVPLSYVVPLVVRAGATVSTRRGPLLDLIVAASYPWLVIHEGTRTNFSNHELQLDLVARFYLYVR